MTAFDPPPDFVMTQAKLRAPHFLPPPGGFRSYPVWQRDLFGWASKAVPQEFNQPQLFSYGKLLEFISVNVHRITKSSAGNKKLELGIPYSRDCLKGCQFVLRQKHFKGAPTSPFATPLWMLGSIMNSIVN
jgi:hypothetical protein